MTTTSPPSSAPRAPGQAFRRLFEAGTGTTVAGRAWRRRQQSPAAMAATRDSGGRMFYSGAGASTTSDEKQERQEQEQELGLELEFDDRRPQKRPRPDSGSGSGSGSWSTRTRTRTRTPDNSITSTGATRRRSRSRSRSMSVSHGSGRFMLMPAAFVASPATPSSLEKARKRHSCSTGLAVGRFAEGAWCAGGSGAARSERPQQPLPLGGGSGGRGGRRRGGRSSDVVAVGGGTGETEYYAW